MNGLERFLSRPTAKPYRSRHIDDSIEPYLNQDGHVDFSEGDIENPKNWSVGRRLYITVVSILMVINAAFASSSPSGTIEGISAYFSVSREAAGLVITLFLLGYCAGPLIFAPLSEFLGRRWVFYGTFICYVAFNFLCAFAPNFGSLLVGRLLSGTFASAPLTNAPGVVADIWDPIQRSNALALFSIMTFVGPAMGPVIAGFLQLTKGDHGWQWVFYVLTMLGGFTAILMFTIPETYPPVVLVNKARRLRALNPSKYGHLQAPAEASGRNLGQIFKVALLRPWQILFDPISFLIAIYLTVVYTLLYMLFTIYPIVFQEKRKWGPAIGQLPLIGTSIGAIIGGTIVLLQSQRDKKRLLAGQKFEPEDRLPLAMLGGVLFTISMFWFAWTANFNSVHWVVPTLAGTFLSSSILLIFVAYLNYLTDTYLMFTASAMAANTIIRSAAAAASPLFTNQMFTALGVGGGGSLIGGVAALLAPIPFVFYKYGKQIRIKSRFAPTKHIEAEENKAADDDDDDEEKQKQLQQEQQQQQQQGSAEPKPAMRRGSDAGASSSTASDESLEYGADYETTEEMEKRLKDREEMRQRELQKVRTGTRSDAGD